MVTRGEIASCVDKEAWLELPMPSHVPYSGTVVAPCSHPNRTRSYSVGGREHLGPRNRRPGRILGAGVRAHLPRTDGPGARRPC